MMHQNSELQMEITLRSLETTSVQQTLVVITSQTPAAQPSVSQAW